MTWPEELAFIFLSVSSLLRVLAMRRNKTETLCVPSTISSSIAPLYPLSPPSLLYRHTLLFPFDFHHELLTSLFLFFYFFYLSYTVHNIVS